MIYSIMPEQEIWKELDKESKSREVIVNGCIVEVESVNGTNGVVKRIVSTDPQNFLKYQPGMSIDLNQ